MKAGDKVRATLGESVLVGTVVEAEPGFLALDLEHRDKTLHTVNPDKWSVEIIAPALPPEPPAGSVVQWIHNGVVWYRRSTTWASVEGGPLGYPWGHVAAFEWVLLIPATQVIEDVRTLIADCQRLAVTSDYITDSLANRYGVPRD